MRVNLADVERERRSECATAAKLPRRGSVTNHTVVIRCRPVATALLRSPTLTSVLTVALRLMSIASLVRVSCRWGTRRAVHEIAGPGTLERMTRKRRATPLSLALLSAPVVFFWANLSLLLVGIFPRSLSGSIYVTILAASPLVAFVAGIFALRFRTRILGWLGIATLPVGLAVLAVAF